MRVLVAFTGWLRRLIEKVVCLGRPRTERVEGFKRYWAAEKRGKETNGIRGMLRPKVGMEELERVYQVEGR